MMPQAAAPLRVETSQPPLCELEVVSVSAVVEVVEFTIEGEKASTRRTAVELVELEQQSSRIKVLIQVLKLRCASEATSDAAADVAWLWKYTYVQLESPSTTT